LVALLGAACLIVIRFTRGWWPGLLPPCFFHRITGLNCPGCGGTRCAIKLTHGDLRGALAMNVFTVIFAFLAVGLLGVTVWREWHDLPPPAVPRWCVWTLFAVFLVFGITRNLPGWPFTLLSPH
jgi:hypothetical protein